MEDNHKSSDTAALPFGNYIYDIQVELVNGYTQTIVATFHSHPKRRGELLMELNASMSLPELLQGNLGIGVLKISDIAIDYVEIDAAGDLLFPPFRRFLSMLGTQRENRAHKDCLDYQDPKEPLVPKDQQESKVCLVVQWDLPGKQGPQGDPFVLC